jgi:hypothetical protein
MAASCRCAECRRTFTAEPSARDTQRVCGKACRKARDLRLARARRRRDLHDARADERERQRTSRKARADAGCHAPPSTRKCPLSDKEVRHFVDRALERSRATLVRDLRGILLRFVPIPGDGSSVGAVVSRATLGVEASDVMDDSGEKLATLSRGSLGVGRRP